MQQNSLCSGIKLWSKYRCRVTVSLWPRTHMMGDTLQCTTNADAEEQLENALWSNAAENEGTFPCTDINLKHKCSCSREQKAALFEVISTSTV